MDAGESVDDVHDKIKRIVDGQLEAVTAQAIREDLWK